MKYINLLSLFIVLITVVACGGGDKSLDENFEPDKPVETLYNEASAEMDAKNYQRAFTLFNEVERQHPYSKWATKAQLMSAYSFWTQQYYSNAIDELQRFIKLLKYF